MSKGKSYRTNADQEKTRASAKISEFITREITDSKAQHCMRKKLTLKQRNSSTATLNLYAPDNRALNIGEEVW